MREYNIFISHSWSYPKAYEGLENLLKNASYFSFKNYSVPKDDPLHINAKTSSYYKTQLYSAIFNQMIHASVVLILAGVYSSYSDSIQMEIEIAKKQRKPIIAVQPWGAEKTSLTVKQSADIIVSWNTNSIVTAIKEVSL